MWSMRSSLLIFFILTQVMVANSLELINGGENDNGKLDKSKWTPFGKTYGQRTRTYNEKIFIYSTPKDKGSGLYQSFSTEVGKSYKVSAILIGSDTNRKEQFNGSSYLTVSNTVPTQNKSHVIAKSDGVTGGKEVTVIFIFDAVSKTSYLALRSDGAWKYANARAISVKALDTTTEKAPTISNPKPHEKNDTEEKSKPVGEELISKGGTDGTSIDVKKWTSFGSTYGQTSRTYEGKTFIYAAAKLSKSGLYQSFPTVVGDDYAVKAILLGSDQNRNGKFKANSYLTVSSDTPTKEESSVIEYSEKVKNSKETEVSFVFTATSTTSYLALRSDKAWQYANARGVSVKKIGEGKEDKVEEEKVEKKESEEDKEAPVITVTGLNPQMVIIGYSYFEQGATASDNIDGDISKNIVIDTSLLDITIPGVYHVLYNVQDKAGNKATQVTRVIKVLRDSTTYNKSDNNDNDSLFRTIYNTFSAWRYYDDPIPKGTPTRYCKTRPPLSAVLGYQYDEGRKSNIFNLSSAYPCISGALFKLVMNNNQVKELQFDAKYDHEFYFQVSIETKKGERILYYTPTDKKPRYYTRKYEKDSKKPYYGFMLGSKYKDGNWHTIRRNLDKDLKSKEPDNELVSIKDFYVSGYGSLDNITGIHRPDKIAKAFVKAYLENDTNTMKKITSNRMIGKLKSIDEDVKKYFKTITSYREMVYFHDLKAMVIAITKEDEEIKFYFSWNGGYWIMDEVL